MQGVGVVALLAAWIVAVVTDSGAWAFAAATIGYVWMWLLASSLVSRWI